MFPLRDNIPTRRFPVLTVALIVANVAVYFFFQGAYGLTGLSPAEQEQRVLEYGAVPCELAALAGLGSGEQGGLCAETTEPPALLTLLASMFMHGGLLHIGGNMLFLWIFGNNIEDSMGRGRFLLFYLLGGAAALLAQTLADPGSAVPTIGASGAVAAVLGAYALLYPRARVVTIVIIIFFVTLIELPALVVLGLWFLLQVLNSSAEQVGQGGVAYYAHIGGFLFGLLLIRAFADRPHDDYDAAGRIPVY